MTVLDRLPSGARVAIIRLRSLGDCVLTTPAIQLLARHRPDLKIAVVVDSRFRSIFRQNPWVAARLNPRWQEVKRFRPQLTINLHGGTRSAWLTVASLAGLRAGFEHFRNGWIYNVEIPRAQEILGVERTVHTAEHLASAMFYLGVPKAEIPRAYLGFEQGGSLPAWAQKPYAVIHPFASDPDKTWPEARFRDVAAQLQASGLEPVFIGANSDDLSGFQAFRCVKGTRLDDLKRLLNGSRLFLGNDSGPAHMAAAFGKPVVVLYGSSDPVVWAPWKTHSESLIGNGDLRSITVLDVLSAVGRVWAKASP